MSNKKSTLSALSELVVPVTATVFALYYLSTIRGIPFLAQIYGGGVSILLLLLCLIASLRVIVKLVRENRDAVPVTFSEVKAALRPYSKAAALVLGMALYIGLMSFIGYPAVSFLFIAGALYILGLKSIPRALLLSLVVTVIGYILFVVFLQVRLPLGPAWLLRLLR
jgi:amino acid transporter